MVEEQYEVTVEKKKSPIAGIIFAVIVILLLLFIPIYMLTYTSVKETVGEQPIQAEENFVAESRLPPPDTDRLLLNETGVIGKAVYTNSGEVIGTLYNIYVDHDTGAIRWVSVLEDNDLNEQVRLITAAKVGPLNGQETISLDLVMDDFLAIPVQTTIDDRLTGLISVRDLPGSTILDPDRGQIGNVLSVTYNEGKVDRVYFITDRDQKEFYVPFQYLNYSNLGETYNQDYNIELSERQAGAIEMYLQNSGQF